MTAPSSLQNRLRTTALCAALSLAPALGLAQGGVMNLLNSLGGGSSGGGLLGAVTGQSAQPQGDDLISLLSRSVENIDEAREID
ncbi:MAG TPA: peptidase M48, partial [Giesbergeria sp.]|nr:peptidase M48 [Giesbergeria sp.]